MHNYVVLEREKEIGCPSTTTRAIFKSLVLAKNSGKLKMKHLEHLLCDGKESNLPVCAPAQAYWRPCNTFKSLLCISKGAGSLGGAVSFYRILSEGSSYRTILLFSFMDSLNGKITSCIRLILPMALQMVSLRQVGLPKYNYKSSQIIKTEENASLQLLT